MTDDLKIALVHEGLALFGPTKYRHYGVFKSKRLYPSKIVISFRADKRSQYQKGHVWGARYQKASNLIGAKDWGYCYSGSEHRIGNQDSITLALSRAIKGFIDDGWRITSVPTDEVARLLKKLHTEGVAEQKAIDKAERDAARERNHRKHDEIQELRNLISRYGSATVERIATLWDEHRWRLEEDDE